jgi:hypothetical protein
MYSTRYAYQILMKLPNFLDQILEKYSDLKFNGNPSSGSRVVPRGRTEGRTDRHDQAKSRFSQLRQRASYFIFGVTL